jgi:hypothetical protein
MEDRRPKFYCVFQKSNSTSISLKNIPRSEAARWKTLSGEPAQRREFFVKLRKSLKVLAFR